MATRFMLVVIMLAGLAGCGQKGPLYSPHPSQAHQTAGQQSVPGDQGTTTSGN
ncbi:LPS translocon maturation chaperone LptM [Celerinatantimonas sp. YJH-8]|uniref:LPS translocon maturation chaperone LptM n=1 Tax=Celerinatantimonas sp. YJH-8 TaxID=3228714 RepID=UPI0038C37603